LVDSAAAEIACDDFHTEQLSFGILILMDVARETLVEEEAVGI
jgi:hypothetical protein